MPAATLVLAIDCDAAGAAQWDLVVTEPCEAMRDELAPTWAREAQH